MIFLVRYNIGLAYFFGSQKDNALKLLEGEKVEIIDPLADIDLGVVFVYAIDSLKDRNKIYSNIYN